MSETEGAHHWLSVLTDLHNRGIQDILIACVDGLKGFPEAIASIFPQTEVQLCVVHQIRNSLRYIASKDQKAFMADLKPVYRADTKAAASACRAASVSCFMSGVSIPSVPSKFLPDCNCFNASSKLND